MTEAAEASGARTGRGFSAPPCASLRELAWALPRMRGDPLTVWQHYYDAHGPVGASRRWDASTATTCSDPRRTAS
jgi:hypothetical protein